MIDEALQYLVAEINQNFRSRFGLNENVVVLSGLVNIDGTPALQQDNKVVLTLLNVEQEKVIGTQGNYLGAGDKTSKTSPSVYVNLYLLFSGYFPGGNYAEALKFISGVIAFFQSRNAFSRADSSGMPDGIEKLILELQKFSYQDLSHIWGMLGSKHMPSVGYKLRMLTINEQLVREQRPVAREIAPEF